MSHRIQFINGRRPYGVDEEDLDWQTVALGDGIDYDNLSQVVNDASELDAIYDGRYTHRVIEIETDGVDVVDPVTKCVSRAIVTTHQKAVA
jgi:hypothetical protein